MDLITEGIVSRLTVSCTSSASLLISGISLLRVIHVTEDFSYHGASHFTASMRRGRRSNMPWCVRMCSTGVRRGKSYKMTNERARWSRQRRKERNTERKWTNSRWYGVDGQTKRERERERIPNPSYIVYRNNGVSFFIVVQLTFSLESVHQNGRR